jgi:hypothetical protein
VQVFFFWDAADQPQEVVFVKKIIDIKSTRCVVAHCILLRFWTSKKKCQKRNKAKKPRTEGLEAGGGAGAGGGSEKPAGGRGRGGRPMPHAPCSMPGA